MDLSKARALVTGGSSGIGLATAQALRARGAEVAICGRDASRLGEVAERIGAYAIPADVANERDVVRLVSEVVHVFGGYDVLINNAGFGSFAPLLDTKLEEMQRVFATNVFGAMLVARESARHFVGQSCGTIVNVASTAGRRGFAGGTAYAASKFALSGMTECWRAGSASITCASCRSTRARCRPTSLVASGRPARATSASANCRRRYRPDDRLHARASRPRVHPLTTVWATNPE
jgi:3-oxoacyl-[acyl-carrier protein] reductase